MSTKRFCYNTLETYNGQNGIYCQQPQPHNRQNAGGVGNIWTSRCNRCGQTCTTTLQENYIIQSESHELGGELPPLGPLPPAAAVPLAFFNSFDPDDRDASSPVSMYLGYAFATMESIRDNSSPLAEDTSGIVFTTGSKNTPMLHTVPQPFGTAATQGIQQNNAVLYDASNIRWCMPGLFLYLEPNTNDLYFVMAFCCNKDTRPTLKSVKLYLSDWYQENVIAKLIVDLSTTQTIWNPPGPNTKMRPCGGTGSQTCMGIAGGAPNWGPSGPWCPPHECNRCGPGVCAACCSANIPNGPLCESCVANKCTAAPSRPCRSNLIGTLVKNYGSDGPLRKAAHSFFKLAATLGATAAGGLSYGNAVYAICGTPQCAAL